MHHPTLQRKSSPSIFLAAQRLDARPISAQSNGSYSSRSFCESTSYGENKSGGGGGGGPNWESILKSILSGAFVVGPGLGLCYWSSSFSDSNSFLCFSDSGVENREPEKKPKFLFGDAYRRKVFFKYEKRIRVRSPPEKEFEYFASIRTPRRKSLMTPADLMRVVVPTYIPSIRIKLC